jgi:hypothetical protein
MSERLARRWSSDRSEWMLREIEEVQTVIASVYG